MSVTINGTNGLTFNDASTQNTSPFTGGLGFRNRIINGAMVIDQRNAGASGTSSNAFTVDRWGYFGSQASKGTWQQNAGAVTTPAGFKNYLGFTSSSAYSVLSTDTFSFYQGIEGFNFSDLEFGTANAQTVTLSFWVRSSLTGTFGGSLKNYAGTRSYPFTYSISAANTWEQKTVTIAGDTSGTWVGASASGAAYVNFGLGQGSSYTATAGAWATGDYRNATGATSVVGTNGATFYITGVQLEKGSTATSFDYRPYGTELVLCQRYYEKTFPIGVAPANNVGAGAEVYFSAPAGGGGFSPNMYFSYMWKVTKRAAPTVVAYNTRSNTSNTFSTYDGTVRADSTANFETTSENAVLGQVTRGTLAIGAITASAEL